MSTNVSTTRESRAGATAHNDARRVALARIALKRRDANLRHDASGAGVRVIIAEPELITREWLVAVLGSAPELEVVAVCQTATELKVTLSTSDADAVVTNIRMPPFETSEGINFVAALRHRDEPVGVVVRDTDPEPEQVLAFLGGGSAWRAYLLKRELRDRDELIGAITRVAVGDSFIDAKVFEVLIDAQVHATRSRLAPLTRREREVLAEIAAGKTNRSIADKLVITPRAVEKHVGAIFSKLDLRDTEAASKRVVAALIYLAETRNAERGAARLA
jgi:DNA-binding NarL/FixJ family response regulator